MSKKCPKCYSILPDHATSCPCGAKFTVHGAQLPYPAGKPILGGQPYQGGQLNQGGQPYQRGQLNQGGQPYQGGYPPILGGQPYQRGQLNQGGQPYQGGYPPNPGDQPYPEGYQPYRGGAGMAVASMVLGILSLVSSCFGFSVILAIISLALGGVSLKGNREGRGMATAGVVCSVIALIVFFVLLIIGVSILSQSGMQSW